MKRKRNSSGIFLPDCGFLDQHGDTIRQWFGKEPSTQLAKRLGTTDATVQKYGKLLGLLGYRETNKKYFRDKVPILHRLGLSDGGIANELSISKQYVASIRKSLGLPVNPVTEELRCLLSQTMKRRNPRRVKTQIQKTVAEKFARASNWPPYLKVSETMIMNVLAKIGIPMTKKQLHSQICHISIQRIAILLCSLMKNNLVINVEPRQKSGKYTLSVHALSLLESKIIHADAV